MLANIAVRSAAMGFGRDTESIPPSVLLTLAALAGYFARLAAYVVE